MSKYLLSISFQGKRWTISQLNLFQRENDLFITLSIVYIQISNTYLPEFLNILHYVEANPVRMCR